MLYSGVDINVDWLYELCDVRGRKATVHNRDAICVPFQYGMCIAYFLDGPKKAQLYAEFSVLFALSKSSGVAAAPNLCGGIAKVATKRASVVKHNETKKLEVILAIIKGCTCGMGSCAGIKYECVCHF